MKLFKAIGIWYARQKSGTVTKVLLNKYFIATLLFLAYTLFIDRNNFIVWTRTRNNLRDQKRQIEYYQREIRTTTERMEHLRSKKDTLERFAREEYMFHESDEDLYIVE